MAPHAVVKTILVFLVSLTIGLVLPNPVWAHGGGGGSSSGGGGGGNGGGGGGGSSSSAGSGGGGNGGGGSAVGGSDGGGNSSAGHGGSTNASEGSKGGQMGHGAKGGEVGIGGGKGIGVAHGLSNGLATALGRAIGLMAKAPGHSNSPQMSKGGKGTTRGRGFGFGHASIGHPGRNPLSGRSSQSQNTSHRGGTPAEHSLAQDQVTHTPQADQVDDQGPGKTKGFVDSLPANQKPQADSVTLNPSLDNEVAIRLQPNPEPLADRSQALNPETIRSDPDKIIALQLHMIHSELDDTVARVKRASMDLTVPDADDNPVTKFPNRIGLQDWTALPTSPELDDDDVIGWRLVPFFGLVLVFLVTKAFSRQDGTSCVPAGYDQATSKSPGSAKSAATMVKRENQPERLKRYGY